MGIGWNRFSEQTRLAGRITLVYAIVGAVWILVSDYVVMWFFTEPRSIHIVQSIKGKAFVAITALLVFYLIKGHLGIIFQSKQQLSESREKFRYLVEHTSDWIWESDRQGRYTYCSPRVKDVLGYEPNEVLGKD